MKNDKKAWYAPKITNLLVLEQTLSGSQTAEGEDNSVNRCDVSGKVCSA